MIEKLKILFAALMFAVLQALAGLSVAWAQREDLYVVSGVAADAEAENSRDARTRAIAAAQVEAANRIVRRLTLAAERASRAIGPVDLATAQRMTVSLEVEQERSSLTRYVGSLKFTFDPSQVRNYLRAQNLQYSENRGAPVLVVAEYDANSAIYADFWRRAWALGGFKHELRPFELAPSGPAVSPENWTNIAAQAAPVFADSAIFVTLSVTAGRSAMASARARQVSANGEIDLGEAHSQAASVEPGAIQAMLDDLARQIAERAGEEWKRQALSRAGAGAGVIVTAYYSSLAEWRRVQTALEQSRLLTGARPLAITAEAAVLSLSFAGGQEQLKADLAKQGLVLQDGASGPALRLAAQ